MVTTRGRRPRLTSLALASAAAATTVAATRLPTPVPLRLDLRRVTLATAHAAARTNSVAAPRHSAPVTRARGRPGPTPRISANWENAPVEIVAAVFARFSGKRIDLAPDVVGGMTARVADEPWNEALTHIMVANGFGLVVHADSSITIVVARSSSSRPTHRLDGDDTTVNDRRSAATELSSITHPSGNRRISGRAVDASTNLPIVGVTIYVIGLQAVGEPNRTCTAEGGTFELKVPDGEVWLDAGAAGYEFTRVTLTARDTEAVFRGRRTPARVAVNSIGYSFYGPLIPDGNIGSPKQTMPLIVIDGWVVGGSPLGPQQRCSSA